MSSSLSIIPTLAAEVGIKNEDIISIAVVRRERSIEIAIASASREQKDLFAAITTLRKKLSKQMKDLATAQWGSQALALEQAFAVFGKKAQVTLTPYKGDEENPWGVSITLKTSGSHYDDTLGSHPLYCSGELTETAAEIAQFEGQLQELSGRIHVLKHDLSNIAQTERRARATLAEATLSGSEQGRAILDAMFDVGAGYDLTGNLLGTEQEK